MTFEDAYWNLKFMMEEGECDGFEEEIKLAREALDRRVSKKVGKKGRLWICAKCGEVVREKQECCDACGQKLGW